MLAIHDFLIVFIFIFMSILESQAQGIFEIHSQPLCIQFPEINFSGDAKYVDTDGSEGTGPTTGDMSIAPNLNGVVTASSTLIEVQSASMQATCIILLSDVPSAPSCDLIVDLSYCANTDSTLVRSRKLRNLRNKPGGKGGGGTHGGGDSNEGNRPRKHRAPKCSEGDAHTGRIMASGTGPEPYAIMGGSGSFFGSFGTVDGLFSTTASTTGAGDIEVSLSMTSIKVCYYPNIEL